ncbi:MAG: transcription-repair coupling factor [Flavobacteriia bacterium]|nr:transcription-repair coupling factor [Flavobacteriia bacterium]
MSKSFISTIFSDYLFAQLGELNFQKKADTSHEKPSIFLNGLSGSALSFAISALFKEHKTPFLILLEDKETAAYILNDLEQFIGEEQLLFYPASYKTPYETSQTDNANILLRAEVLQRLGKKEAPICVVSYPEAIFEKVLQKKTLEKNTLTLQQGDLISLEFLNETLFEYRFKRVDFVTGPGEFSVRGGIVDVFSYSYDHPYRIEFFGEEIESIRSFDIVEQRSIAKQNTISIVPNISLTDTETERCDFLSFLGDQAHVFVKKPSLLKHKISALYTAAEQKFSALDGGVTQLSPAQLFTDENALFESLASNHTYFIESHAEELAGLGLIINAQTPAKNIHFKGTEQPAFNKKFSLLMDRLRQNHQKGMENFIFCASVSQSKRFEDIFAESKTAVPYKTVVGSIYKGFEIPNLKIACYTDHEIFERYHKFHIKNGFKKKEAISLSELNKLEIGDYVTHIDHGIGKFGGLQKIEVEGKKQEAIKLAYGERDVLYVSIHSLHKIAKFNGKDGAPPKIYKLGSGAWKKIKEKTKSRVKKLAFDLIQIYAKRRLQKGFQYGPDSSLQHELEASFIYEDTPDQVTATEDIKKDMESERPMDRLICGDVGFGKTEVAIRAAFKAVDNGKQVAILVPTTILAYQHFNTITARLSDMPVTVDYLNRFRTAKEKKDTLERLAAGKVDIIIGTHQLVNKKVQFKDLGLLIVDEEQKFGVGVKDKLKAIKENVDVLTLTATPIPRTLQFSLMAARDLSVINTAPPNRYPIESSVVRFNEALIRDAISYEIQRDGQVFFIHNRIENIKEVAGLIQRLVPDARVAVGHGQMDGKKLESLMQSFMGGGFDVLVSTTIIESGLDVSNANTIFINNANNFGLSDLHQMRGRVGRSNKKAFCYFITPPYEVMTADARKRIQALEQFTALGSGFNIAMKDLEIRGAGDILGGEQSGFINEIGFETYQKIMAEAIDELKNSEFKDLYEEEVIDSKDKKYVTETQMDTDIEMLFPDDYINSTSERLSLYTALNAIEEEKDLVAFEEGLVDRFGPIPAPAADLLTAVRLKWMANYMGIEKVVMKQSKFLGYFIADQQSEFYQSDRFRNVLSFVQNHSKQCTLKEKQTRNGLRLLLLIDGVQKVATAHKILCAFQA